MGKYCIYCGAEDSPDNPVVNNVCLRCRMKRGELVIPLEKEMHFEMCKICYSIRLGHKWIETNGFEDAIGIIVNNYIMKKVKPGEGVTDLVIDHYEPVTVPSWRTVVRVYFRGRYGGKEFIYPLDFTIYFKPSNAPGAS
jgi:nonsense-mediated mRNA decay protein 3